MKMKIGNRLMQAREDRKLNQIEMGKLLDMSQSAYSRVERNEVSLDIEEVVNFSKKLEIPIQEFLPDTVSINNTNQHGQGLMIGNIYNYNDRELAIENSNLKEKITLLEKRIADLESVNEILKKLIEKT